MRWSGHAWVPASAAISGRLIALIAGTVAVALIAVSVMAYVSINAAGRGSPTPAAGSRLSADAIPCDGLEHTQVHYHAHLQIVVNGSLMPISTSVGRTGSCFYWLHMHSGEQGMIHIEAPSDRTFTLADFFWVWGAWSGTRQFLDSSHVSTMTLSGGQALVVYIDQDDGSGPRLYRGDPQKIALKPHEMITLEITPPALDPPPVYAWPAGL
jgi:hypothetical protein